MFSHISVLLHEAIEGLNIKPDGIYVDCTVGGAGHSYEIVKKLTTGHLYGFDQDEEALRHAEAKLAPFQGKFTLIHGNFRYLKDELAKRGVFCVDGILFDLGVSSPQLDEAERGFSYQHDALLDMRMDKSQTLTAYEIVNEWDFEKIALIIAKYGEEKFAKQIARKIERARQKKPIETTGELVEIIKEAIPARARRTGPHPAKRTFQALRIAVNDELNAFEEALNDAIELLKEDGRICVITFHSLEDRICKQIFKRESEGPELLRGLPIVPEEYAPKLEILTKKPITPSEEEIERNHRARSAKLRIARKNGGR